MHLRSAALPAKHSFLFYHQPQLPGCVGGCCFMKEAVGILNPPEEIARCGCLAAVG